MEARGWHIDCVSRRKGCAKARHNSPEVCAHVPMWEWWLLFIEIYCLVLDSPLKRLQSSSQRAVLRMRMSLQPTGCKLNLLATISDGAGLMNFSRVPFPDEMCLWSSPDTLVCDQGIKWLEWTSEKYTAEQELQRRQAYNGNKHYSILIHSLQGQTYLLIRLSEAFEQSWGLWNIWFIKKSGICDFVEVYTQQISSKCEAVD